MPASYNPSQFEIFGKKIDWPRQSFLSARSDEYPLFWIDALCVPVSEAHSEVRQLAINQMASIYAGAEQVLVLDAALQNFRAASASASEILAAIIKSNWMTRAWTLQEGSLGREIVFQFADMAIDPINTWSWGGPRDPYSDQLWRFPPREDILEDWIYRSMYNILWDKTRQNWKHSLWKQGNVRRLGSGTHLHALEARYLGAFKRIIVEKHKPSHKPLEGHFESLDTEASRCEQLITVWNEMIHRSTTKPEDIHTIVANLLDFHVKQVQQIGVEASSDKGPNVAAQRQADRMRGILLNFQTLPLSMLLHKGSSLQPLGFSWIESVPATSLAHPKDKMHLSTNNISIYADDLQNHEIRLYSAMEWHSAGIEDAKMGDFSPFDTTRPLQKAAGELGAVFAFVLSDTSLSGALIHISGFTRSQSIKEPALIEYRLHGKYRGAVSLASASHVAIDDVEKRLPTKWILELSDMGIPSTKVTLPRRPSPLIFNRGGAAQAVALFGFMCPALTFCFTFAALQARQERGLTAVTAALMITWLSLQFGALGGYMIFSMFGVPIAHRSWLRSFDDDWVPEKAGRGWIAWLELSERSLLNTPIVDVWAGFKSAILRWLWRHRSTSGDVELALEDENHRFIRRFNLKDLGDHS
ncbi:hypothetical protein CAC42_5687 [Sphaceloma murrayae]|uniref:Heterokaryon incompatibility domain-containing protein n=1 Tax=Sphaceloma murrayae TaxID=2082308 RepID=A0A2K1QYX9_9PEZI|nr:hypothetical protein CAC42_5687 [Sphaceloma murrayae]